MSLQPKAFERIRTFYVYHEDNVSLSQICFNLFVPNALFL